MIAVERLSVGGSERTADRRPGRFLKGPIGLRWLTAAACLPGRALQVGVAVWFMAGVQRSQTVRLAPKLLSEFVANRHAGYRGLRALEAARLVRVVRRAGAAPEVTILESATDDR
jgi:hypothetical protein